MYCYTDNRKYFYFRDKKQTELKFCDTLAVLRSNGCMEKLTLAVQEDL